MANVLVEEQSLQDIADAIRLKNGSSDTYTPAEMAQEIEDLQIGGGGVLFNIVPLTVWKTQTWIYHVDVGYQVGYQSSSNNWYIAKCQVQKDKKYIVTTRNAATECFDVVVISNDNYARWSSGYRVNTSGLKQIILVDTSGLDDSNGLNIIVAYGKQDATYSLNNDFLSYVPSANNEYNISVSEIIQS